MGLKITLTIALSYLMFMSNCYSQDSMYRTKSKTKKVANPAYGHDIPEFIITYEVVPKDDSKCSLPINTIIFEIPVDEDYFRSLSLNQEVSTNWGGGIDTSKSISGSIITKNENRWKLIVRAMRIQSKTNDPEFIPTNYDK